MKKTRTHTIAPDELERTIQFSRWFIKRSRPGERLILGVNQDVPEYVRKRVSSIDAPPRQVMLVMGSEDTPPRWVRDMSLDDFITTFTPHILRITGGGRIVSHRLLWGWPHEDWAAEFVIQVDD